MKPVISLIVSACYLLCIAACENNNSNTGGVDSASVSTNPAMGGSTDSTGMSSSDSTDIRMPMTDSSHRGDSSMHK